MGWLTSFRSMLTRTGCFFWLALALAAILLITGGQTITSFSGLGIPLVQAQTLPWNSYLPLVNGGNKTILNPSDSYVLLGWNDLGMHCYNRDFTNLAVLPPYNTLWAQVIKRGDPPQIVTQGITVDYSFAGNTYSVGKSNFWDNAQKLFNLPSPLPANVGLTGRGLSGPMSVKVDHFIAEGIPLTEYSDIAPATRDPYQLSTLIARDASTGAQLASLPVVAPVSTEMRCDRCHSDGQRQGISTGKVETNILTLHDREEKTNPSLMQSQPVLCANCHGSNALGMAGNPSLPNLSNAMHSQHAEVFSGPQNKDTCYNCHPGPSTQCLRDVMSTQKGMDCTNCHGTMFQVARNSNPWLSEPRCDSSGCHAGQVSQNNALYRFSTGHNGVYCEACHDSTHAIAPSAQSKDGIKFVQLQGHAGPLDVCTTCHLTQPSGSKIH
jgi:hypothetical protein